MGWLCGVEVFGLVECSHSLPALHSGLQLIIIIIIIIHTSTLYIRCFELTALLFTSIYTLVHFILDALSATALLFTEQKSGTIKASSVYVYLYSI